MLRNVKIVCVCVCVGEKKNRNCTREFTGEQRTKIKLLYSICDSINRIT